MKRLLVVLLAVVAVAAVVVTAVTRSSRAAGPRVGVTGRVVVTPGLRKILRGEISTLRLGQPRVVPQGVTPRRFLAPTRGVPCFVAAQGPRCPEIPCRQFASASVVLKTGSTVLIAPGARARRRRAVPPACSRHAPRKLVLVSGP